MPDTPNDHNAASPSRTRKKRGNSSRNRQRIAVDRRTPLHQSRILAMQALYEDDITDHTLDDILQHIGVSRRRDLETYFQDLERTTQKTVETIAFLARNAGRDASGATLEEFHDAATRAMTPAEPTDDATDMEVVDPYIAVVQSRVNHLVNRILESYRDRAHACLQKLDPSSDRSIEADEEADEALASLEADSRRQLRDTYAREERASLDTLLEMIRRTDRLAHGVQSSLATIDPYIERAAPAFPLPQLASIDRIVLRLALYEVLYENDVPYKVAINEAVEVAKQFGGPKSGKFVNGVLRTISDQLPEKQQEAG